MFKEKSASFRQLPPRPVQDKSNCQILNRSALDLGRAGQGRAGQGRELVSTSSQPPSRRGEPSWTGTSVASRTFSLPGEYIAVSVEDRMGHMSKDVKLKDKDRGQRKTRPGAEDSRGQKRAVEDRRRQWRTAPPSQPNQGCWAGRRPRSV